MHVKQMDIITKHFDKHFGQTDSKVLHPLEDNGFHVDVLLYEPNERFPFWKLVTMGASDYKMPPHGKTFSRYNEYMMFVHADEDLTDMNVVSWYFNKLIMVASYAHFTKCYITYGHSFEWQIDEEDSGEMIAAYIEMPQVIPDVDILRCKLGLFKTVTCLQVVLLDKDGLDKLKSIGSQAFSEYLYPYGEGDPHFISERYRSDRF